ncbi:hypothetical protein BpHYR1_050260 [Brachionus plicatilis]|uniref:Uncharacterized protein n=1 Tax=Brachionus plicatilis TaxID=10195 RepID=A0A3M7RV95_BRAPC|nr:hypothetical protein BpHYR1_050260 [Brachionus plicatilis]
MKRLINNTYTKKLTEETLPHTLEKDLITEVIEIIDGENESLINNQVSVIDKIKATLYVLEVNWDAKKFESEKAKRYLDSKIAIPSQQSYLTY